MAAKNMSVLMETTESANAELENPWIKVCLPSKQTRIINKSFKSSFIVPTMSHNHLNQDKVFHAPKTSDSYFEIESLSDQSPYFDSLFQVISPHEPPIDQVLPMNSSIKNHIIQNRININDRFTHVVEDRMLRWNCSTSQHNVDPIITGTHPYQSQAYELPVTSILDSIRNWFTGTTQYPPLQQSFNNSSSLDSPSSQLSPANLEKVIGLKFRPNSSKSFLTQSMINNQYFQSDQQTCTPVAQPIYDFNFDKTTKEPTFDEFESIDNILSTNFLNSCFDYCTSSICCCNDEDSF